MTFISSGPFTGLLQNHYGVIECDPPWGWLSYSGKSSAPHRTEEAPYPVMTLDEMKALPVADVAAKDCLLHMWVIGSHLEQAFELGRAWGFTFRSDGFVWVKTGKNDPAVRPIGMGKWVRKGVEYGLLWGRGKPSRSDAGVRQLIETDEQVIYEQVIYEPRREHSRKPDCRYERLERLAAGPYLEMFGRQQRDGWSIFGNETTKFNADPLMHNDFESLLG